MRGTRHGSHRIRKLLIAAASLIATLVAIYWLRVPILRWAAGVWVIHDGAQSADAIMVLGESKEWRLSAAAELYRDGYAPIVLTAVPRPDVAVELGLHEPDEEVAQKTLIRKGVPRDAIVPLGRSLESTFDEVRALRNWASTSGAQRILIPTDPFHTRRLKWTCRRIVPPEEVTCIVVAIPPSEYNTANWWRSEEVLMAFENEVIRFLYYIWKY